MRVLLTAGGWSSEREVSLSGAKGIEKALKILGHEVVPFDPAVEFDNLMTKARTCDFAFLNLHGAPGEDGLIQAVLEAAGVPYQGADPRGSFLALNKAASKQIFRDAGLLTPDWEFLPRRPADDWTLSVDFPVFIKSNNGGSSLDMARARRPEELRSAMEPIFAKGLEVLIEADIHGDEITCAVLDHEALPTILIRPKSEFFDYTSKYLPGGAEEICPAPVSEELTQKIQEASVKAHQALKLKGYSRADFMVRQGVPYLLEVNTLPGMTQTSLLPQSAAAAGYTFEALVQKLIDIGLRDHSTPAA